MLKCTAINLTVYKKTYNTEITRNRSWTFDDEDDDDDDDDNNNIMRISLNVHHFEKILVMAILDLGDVSILYWICVLLYG